MKKIILTYSSLLIFIGLLQFPILGQKIELIKKVHETYTISKDSNLKLSNKFGKMEIVNGNNDKVEIDVTIKAWGRNENEAEKLLSDIDIQLTHKSNDIEGLTIVNANNHGRHNGFEINYLVHVPKWLPMDLTNKYGPMILGDHEGQIQLEVAYGKLIAGQLTGHDSQLEIKYSSMQLEGLTKGELEMKYCNDSYLGTVGKAYLDIGYGGITIDKAEKIYGEVKYGNLKIGYLTSVFKVESGYSNVKVEKIAQEFNEISMENKYGNVTLNFIQPTNFNFNCSAKYGNIHLKNFIGLDIYKDIDIQSQKTLEGIVGDSKSKSIVNLETKYGNISLHGN